MGTVTINSRFRRNRKTGLSFDCSTICPRLKAGKACAYCYVEDARRTGVCAKHKHDYVPYDGWVLRLKQSTVDKQNESGGVRMFSFGDYEARFRKDVKQFLDDCLLRGLKAKVITKVPLFIYHFHNHPAVQCVHVGVDSLQKKGGSPISYEKAKALRKAWPKVLVRSVCLTPEDLVFFGKQKWVDVLTLYHGRDPQFHHFTVKERAEAKAKFTNRLCCSTGICSTCDTKCRAFHISSGSSS